MQPAGGVEPAPRLPRLPGLAVSDGLSGRLAGAAAASANGQRDREAASACGGCARKAADAGRCRARLTVAFGLSLLELVECLSDAAGWRRSKKGNPAMYGPARRWGGGLPPCAAA